MQTTHPITGQAVAVAHTRRAGVRFATWAKFSDGWEQVGTSVADNVQKAIRSAKSTAPYATDWTATPARADQVDVSASSPKEPR